MAASDRGVYAISVAAEMVSMEIQNLRVYEQRGLLTPDRTAGGSRLNLAGIARVLALEAEVARLRARLDRKGSA